MSLIFLLCWFQAGLSIHDLPTYDVADKAGEFHSVDDWLKVVEIVLKLHKVDQKIWPAYAASRLRGKAIQYWDSKKQDIFNITWEVFCNIMKETASSVSTAKQ